MTVPAPLPAPEALKRSWTLLNVRERRTLILAALAQMSTSFLDLVGVLLIGGVTALAVAAGTGSSAPPMLVALFDRFGVSSSDPVALVAVLAVLAAAVLILKSFLSVYLTRRTLRFLAHRQAAVAGRLAEALLSRPLLQVQQRSSQETAYALTNGVNLATLIILGQAIVAMSELVLLVVLGIGLLLVDPLVTAFAVAYFAGIAVVLQRLMSGWAGRMGKIGGDAEIESYAAVQEALRTYREVTVSHRRGLYIDRFQALRSRAATVQADLAFMQLVPKYLFEVALVIGAGALAAVQLTSRDLATAIATIVVFLAAGSRVVPSMLRLQGATLSIRSASGGATTTYELASELGGAATEPNASALASRELIARRLREGNPTFVPDVTIQQVCLTFPNTSEPALIDISIKLTAGQSLALTGSTGAGKSTLADVVLGVLSPDSGTVIVGGVSPLEAIARWPGAMAYVPQDVAMANGSIRENVALGLPNDMIDDDRVWEALRRAHLADFLVEAREGLDTLIGENGIKLSGGQRQRLGMARALYTRPRLLVLDEATSALDAETEQAIVETLEGLEGDVTTITVAHRLATIRHSDVVAFMDRGQVVALGSFDEVRRLASDFNRQAELLGL